MYGKNAGTDLGQRSDMLPRVLPAELSMLWNIGSFRSHVL